MVASFDSWWFSMFLAVRCILVLHCWGSRARTNECKAKSLCCCVGRCLSLATAGCKCRSRTARQWPGMVPPASLTFFDPSHIQHTSSNCTLVFAPKYIRKWGLVPKSSLKFHDFHAWSPWSHGHVAPTTIGGWTVGQLDFGCFRSIPLARWNQQWFQRMESTRHGTTTGTSTSDTWESLQHTSANCWYWIIELGYSEPISQYVSTCLTCWYSFWYDPKSSQYW